MSTEFILELCRDAFSGFKSLYADHYLLIIVFFSVVCITVLWHCLAAIYTGCPCPFKPVPHLLVAPRAEVGD